MSDFTLLGLLIFIVGLFIKNKKWKRICIYGGLAIFLIFAIIYFEDAKNAFQEGFQNAVDNRTED